MQGSRNELHVLARSCPGEVVLKEPTPMTPKRSPAQLNREIAEALSRAPAHGIDTVQPRRLTGQPLPPSRPTPPPHGIDTVQPRRLSGQPLPASRPAPPPHGIDTVRPRRAAGTSHARKKGAAHATKRSAKTQIVHVIQGNYGYGHGWEDVTAEETREEALKRLREYRENEPGVSFRRIRRRERILSI